MGPSTESLALADFLISKLGLQVDRISLAYAIMDHVEVEYADELAQPSPGGQGESLVESLVQVMNAQYDGLGYLPADVLGVLNMAVEALAARQPVGAVRQGCDACDRTGIRRNGEGRNIWCPDCDLGRACAGDTRQPVGEPVTFQLAGSEPLWCLHVLGMDDVHPAPSKAHAEKAAAWHNEQFKDQAERLGISIEAKVVPWPHSAESHAAGVAEFIPQWLIPQWQLDALEANAAQPAQAVDLGLLREAVAYAARSADFATHVEIGSKLRELLALIDSKAVGK
ncbi:TPA: hypothetical protein UOJ01_001326 [Stenotrophomonas maltophilia]|uniref:hypothetical protein n=1 Tax=Stenotrophomonas maltophilia TaxID=40324 RepID=UPI0018D36A10|nr:hypothetical protein [Stenotrophomonas maltophilia]MBH1603987.1 hypothetical protein [Stenotrophomonas maltophilia]MDT3472271.1 hypothetical protein [Stenotrophomonas maltophilia]MDT3473913.1 hypothetical protein [Stenotrophomonas maltophilia]HEL5342796.1 hypothetical protein [Stenotrophomonas maltophilia]